MNDARRLLAFFAAAAMTTLVASSAAAAEPRPIAVGEVTETAGIDTASVRSAAEGEIAEIDVSQLPAKRHFLVSLAVARSTVGDGVACTVNAMLRDAKTGAMIAIIESGAQAAGSATEEVTRKVASVAVRNAMRRIPTALGAK
jgi:hypothetical protein